MKQLPHFRYWCYKVLPLVYDDSLSYYEVLCRVVKYINNLIDNDKEIAEDIEELQKELEEVQKWIDEFDTRGVDKYLEESFAEMIYCRISDAGYFIYYIPESWNDITFNTTGLDITNEQLTETGNVGNYDYGHLVLSYNV